MPPARLKKKYYKLGDTNLFILKCKCGWNFLAVYSSQKYCPQCKDEKKFCLKCGNVFKSDNLYCESCRQDDKKIWCAYCGKEKENPMKVFCYHCETIDKKITFKNISKRIERIKTFKESRENICNYDCNNCIYDDCIQPVDSDDLTLPLFKTE